MEVIRIAASVLGCIQKLVNLVELNKVRDCTLKVDLEAVKHDLEVLCDLRIRKKKKSPEMQLKCQELVYDIDDFIQDLCVPGELGSFIPTAIGVDSRPGLILHVGGFKERIKNLREELPKSSESIPDGSTSTPTRPSWSARPPMVLPVGIERPKMEILELLSPGVEPHIGRLSLISIVGRSGSGKTAFARALYEDDDVAKDFYYKAWVVASDPSSGDILTKILEAVVLTSAPESNSQASQQARASTSEALQHLAKNKRYLVFIDDVQQCTTCEDIKNAFHENVMSSRIIVTTNDSSIAMECSSGSFVYTMEGLDKEDSRELFRQEFRGKAGYSEKDKYRLGNTDVDVIVDKCGGLPIALISAAECLRGKKRTKLKGTDFVKVSQELGDNLECSESDFEHYKNRNGNPITCAQMRRAIVEPYEHLLNTGEKECLLYLSIFPSGYQISSKSLVRIIMAEGLGPGDPHIMKDSELAVTEVCECLRMLMEQRMMDPVPLRSNCNAAKRGQVHSIILQFTIKSAVKRNLLSLIQKGKCLHNTAGRVRRLTIQSSSNSKCTRHQEKMDFSVLRSLAIFERGIVNFEKCKLVRVLSLEGCKGLTPKDIDKICQLVFLKYLSLRKTGIKELPENVKKLQCLETLDTRGTVVLQLPVEVIMLPRFAYLFGQFELTNVKENIEEITKFFEGDNSELHTLGGVSVDVTQGLELVLLVLEHATGLKKVKVWYKDTPSSTDMVTDKKKKFRFFRKSKPSAEPAAHPTSNTHGPASATSTLVAGGTAEPLPCVSRLAETLEKHSGRLASVSVDFKGFHNTFMDFLQTNGTIGSIKLRKGLGKVPGPADLGNVCNLHKLHLLSTGLTSNELGALQGLNCLQYLKLAEDGTGLWDSIFHVKVGGFISLIWLCFESSNSLHPPLMIDEGVETPLASLLLLCEESKGPQTKSPVSIGPQMETEQAHIVRDISHLPNLNEVILHPSASDAVAKAWKEEARKHINRPYVEKKPEENPEKKQV